MYTLGINAAFHDTAACLVRNGEIIAASEEERFNHVKHGKRPIPFSAYELPFHAIDDCLKQAGITLGKVDHVAYSFNPYLLMETKKKLPSSIEIPFLAGPSPKRTHGWETPWDPLFLSLIANAPGQLMDGVPLHLQKRIKKNEHEKFEWHFVDHHTAHAASAFFPSPFKQAAVLVLDGRGEKTSTSFYVGKGRELNCIHQVEMPHSLGLLYERLTSHLGFLHSCDEYKVMALASYGKPCFVRQFEKIIESLNDGNYRIGSFECEEIFGPARANGGALEQRHFDIAHSLQVVLEKEVLRLSRWLFERTGEKKLCLAGGVALNCVMNAKLRDRGPYENIWVQPAAGDAGTALGAALWVDVCQRKSGGGPYPMTHAYLGPEYRDDEIEDLLRSAKISYRRLDDIANETAEILKADKIIGWFQGRMEFGPRALGARSILASPIHPEMQARLNEIKDREDFRPVAPVVLEEEAPDWFKHAGSSPFMLFVYDVWEDKIPRIPAVCHIDKSARIQTINRSQNPLYYDLLKAFQKKTGIPILVNTSFNTRGKPIVCSPRDALESFWTSPLDALVMGSFMIQKGKTHDSVF